MNTVGILGGMGPGAGVYFKNLIVEGTKTDNDQEHIEAVLYTNPSIPDRTTCIKNGDLNPLVNEIVFSLKRLEAFGVSELFIPCNTAFVGYQSYEELVDTPIYHLPNRTLDTLAKQNIKSSVLFATEGTYLSDVYGSHESVSVVCPEVPIRSVLMSLIYEVVKAGDYSKLYNHFSQLNEYMSDLEMPVILGCTELSMLSDQFRDYWPEQQFVDPLEITVDYIVGKYKR